MRLSVVMGQLERCLVLKHPSLNHLFLGAPSPQIHAPSVPVSMVSYSHLFQVQKVSIKKGFCSTYPKSTSKWRGKDPQSEKHAWDQG